MEQQDKYQHQNLFHKKKQNKTKQQTNKQKIIIKTRKTKNDIIEVGEAEEEEEKEMARIK